MTLIRWDPWEEVNRLRDEFDRVFGFPGRLFGVGRGGAWTPSVDVYETADEVVVKAELPGVEPGNLDVRLTEDAVTLRGEMGHEEREEGEEYYRRERRFGSFYRVVPLPAAIRPEEGRATFRHGVLEVRAPKAEPERARGRRLQIEEVH